MERWRSFFAQADADLWTIINQAILLAAADFPADFKHKRCEIAEILFARRPFPSPPTRNVDAMMLSGSVITNATGDGEKQAPHQACWEEDNGARHAHASHGEDKVADTLSHGTISKTSSVDRHTLQDDKSVELDTCLRSYNDDKDVPEAAHGLVMDHIVLQYIAMIKDQIMDSANQSEDGLLRSLHVLEHVDITVDILKATDIGREVNKLRKHPSVPVRNLAKQLVRMWKGMVDKWVKTADIVPPLKDNMLSREEQKVANREVLVRHLNLQTETSAQRSSQLSKQVLNKSTVDCRSTANVSLHTEHAVEEMGSSRVESDELYRSGFMERKPNSCAQQIQFICYNGSLAPGRPVTSCLEAESVLVNGTLACEHHVKSLSAVDYKRHEDMKRRLSLEDQHVESAKKQRNMLPSSSPERPKRGFLSVKSQHCTQRR